MSHHNVSSPVTLAFAICTRATYSESQYYKSKCFTIAMFLPSLCQNIYAHNKLQRRTVTAMIHAEEQISYSNLRTAACK